MSENTSLQTLVDSYAADVAKFQSGNSAAGTRARKALQDIIKFAREERKKIQEEKNARKAAK